MTLSKILFIGDYQLINIDIKKKLHKLGYIVSAITDLGGNVISKISEENPNIVLIDISSSGKINTLDITDKIQLHQAKRFWRRF